MIKASTALTNDENAVAISYSSQCKCYTPSEIFSGTKNETMFDYTLTQIYPTGSGMFEYRGSVAQAHTHPKDNYAAPSAIDFYTLANINGANMLFKSIYTIGYDGSEYNLFVEDANKLNSIKLQYPRSTNVDTVSHGFIPTSIIGKEFYNVKQEFLKKQKFSEDDAYAYALAYILEAYDTGVRLLKKDGSTFKEMHATKRTNASGTIIYRASDCL
jgi:hypothetical protein